MIRYKIYQNQQKKGLNAGKWFARAVSDESSRNQCHEQSYVIEKIGRASCRERV